MKNKCTYINLCGFRGFLTIIFLIVCLIGGFILFPSWCCQHAWNYVAGFVNGMPVMNFVHGTILWFIIVLVAYVTMFGKVNIKFVSLGEEELKNVNDINPAQIIKSDITEEIEQEEIKK